MSKEDCWTYCADELPPEEVCTMIGGTRSKPVLATLVDRDVMEGRKPPYKGDRIVAKGLFRNGKFVCFSEDIRRVVPLAWRYVAQPARMKGEKGNDD